MAIPHLEPAPHTVHWGFFEADLKPLVTIASGDRVTLSTVSGTRDMMPASPLVVPPALAAIHASNARRMVPGHICTGPVAIAGARPGQVLQVEIEAIEPYYDWGYTHVRPLVGALPDDFSELRVIHSVLDRTAKVWRLPWGQTVPFAPFFGVMAVAPPAAWGTVSTLPPRRNGGNLDNKELVAGTTLYLPIFTPEALFSVGDGHGVQGDGEVSGLAMECPMEAELEFHLHPGMRLSMPRALTAAGWVTFGFHEDLNEATVTALDGMLSLMQEQLGCERKEAIALASLVVDLHVTQLVNGVRGVHAILRDGALIADQPRGR